MLNYRLARGLTLNDKGGRAVAYISLEKLPETLLSTYLQKIPAIPRVQLYVILRIQTYNRTKYKVAWYTTLQHH